MPDKRKKRIQRALLGLSMVFLLSCAAWTAWKLRAPAPPPGPKPKAAVTASHAPAARTSTKPVEKEETKNPVRQIYNSGSTLGDLSRYRGQRMLLEQQVRIAELEQRLKDLAAPKRPEIVLPDLLPPKTAPAPAAAPAPKPKRPVVVSVQGVGGLLSASIRTSEGRIVTVKNGASFAGGTLLVTRKGVSVRRNGKLSAIPFE